MLKNKMQESSKIFQVFKKVVGLLPVLHKIHCGAC
jgi:hypothetical protein